MRLALVAAVCLSIVGLGVAAESQAAMVKMPTNIPAQGLGPALKTLAKDRGLQLVFRSEIVGSAHTQGAVGNLTTPEALSELLKGTDLSYSYLDSNTVTIVSSAPSATSTSADQRATTQDQGGNGKKSSQDFRVAQVDQGQAASDSAVRKEGEVQSPDRNPGLTEIIVTAQKREQRLQDVPVPVSVISGDALVESNQVRIQDYFNSIPGLSVAPYSLNGAPNLAIRGISTGAGIGNPTVGITVDDAPYGSSTSLGGGAVAPDIDPNDLARVEVLRGPQGTLYGAGSIGGLVKFVTVDPTTDDVSGRIQADANGIRNGDGPGYGFRTAINVPLSETVAIRATAFARRDPGYVDNVATGEQGVNWANAEGGRLAALWRPSESVSLKVSALLQHSTVHGSSEVDPTLGDLKQNFIPDTGGIDRQTQVYSANFNAKVAGFDLTAISSYGIDTRSDSFDLTPSVGSFATLPIFHVLGTPEVESNKTTKFTQEIRMSVPIGTAFEWLVGGFYDHESSPYEQKLLAANGMGAIVGEGGDFNWAVTYAEFAAFTDVTIHFTDQFDIQIGGRESQNRQTYMETDSGPFIPIFFPGFLSPIVYPKVHTKDNSFTYLVTPSYKITPDLMAYARVASGYRPGGPNPTASALGLPLSFNPDKTTNYELGFKGGVPGRAFTFDASLYYIDWQNIQLEYALPPSYFGFLANGNRAKSEGVELAVESRPLTGLTVSAWIALNDAKLTQNLPPSSSVSGSAGDPLPYSSRFSSNLSLEQEFALSGRATGFVGGAVSYVSRRTGEFVSIFVPPDRQVFPSYAKTDIRTGVKFDSWTVDLFANNIADRRAALSGGIGNYNSAVFRYMQPRTIGVNLTKRF